MFRSISGAKSRWRNGRSKKSARKVNTTRSGLAGSVTATATACRKASRSAGLTPAREQLLELVDDEQDDAVVVGKDPSGAAQHAARTVAQLREQFHRRVDGNTEQRRLECFERLIAGDHRGHEPA